MGRLVNVSISAKNSLCSLIMVTEDKIGFQLKRIQRRERSTVQSSLPNLQSCN